MKETINKLMSELKEIENRKKDLERAIEALQLVCDHKFEPYGHTHKEIEKCSECGMEITI